MRAYALAVMDDLVAQGVKLLVIACNTASAAMFRDARERYTIGAGIPVVEVIQPAVRAAARQTRTKRIGVIGTEGTVRSHAYDDAFVADPAIQVVQAACPRFVEFVEAGVTTGPELFAAAEEYLAPAEGRATSTPSLLGCTHYPLLSGAIRYVMGPGRRARLQRGGDRERRLPAARRARPAAHRRPPPPDATASRRPATSEARSSASPGGSSAPRCASVDLVQTGAIPAAAHRTRRIPMTERRDGRAADDLRPVTIERGWSTQAEGSALDLLRRAPGCSAPRRSRTACPRWLQGKGTRLGHRRVRDAAARHERAHATARA